MRQPCFEVEMTHGAPSVFGADRVMMGSDYPFPIGNTERSRIVNDSRLSAAEKAGILGNLAERIFKLENCGC